MLINRPKKVIARVGKYNIIVKCEEIAEADDFNKFCDEFQSVLMAMVGQQKGVINQQKQEIVEAEVVHNA